MMSSSPQIIFSLHHIQKGVFNMRNDCEMTFFLTNTKKTAYLL